MLRKKSKRIVIITALLFLVMQTLIFASIPKDTDTETIKVLVKNGTSTYSIANKLKDEGIIYSSNLFLLIAFLSNSRLKAGEYDLSKNMSTIDILRKLEHGERNIYVLKIVEGFNIFNVADMMEQAGIMNKDQFIMLAKNREYLKRLGIVGDSLEGYLAPDTYHYSKEIDIENLSKKLYKEPLNCLKNRI